MSIKHDFNVESKIITGGELAQFLDADDAPLTVGSDSEYAALERLDQDVAVQDFMGMQDTSTGRRGLYGAASAKDLNDAEEKARKQSEEDQFFLAQLQLQIAEIEFEIRELEEHVAKTIAVRDKLASGEMDMKTALKDEATQRAIAEWEKRTGKKFDPNDPNAQAVLLDILAQQIAKDRNKIKGLEDDRDRLKDVAKDADARIAAGEDPSVVVEDTRQVIEEAKDAYAAGRTIRKTATEEIVSEAAREEQDHASDQDAFDDAEILESDDMLSTMFGDSALDNAAAKPAFDVAAAAPSTPEPEITTDSQPDSMPLPKNSCIG